LTGPIGSFRHDKTFTGAEWRQNLVGTFRFNGGPPVGLRRQSGRSLFQYRRSEPAVHSAPADGATMLRGRIRASIGRSDMDQGWDALGDLPISECERM